MTAPLSSFRRDPGASSAHRLRAPSKWAAADKDKYPSSTGSTNLFTPMGPTRKNLP
eukprot:CAMPEP_0204360128 /NCGR_PEP_ID=MMETSP0469-20131031/37801_1 /ASSEMBLY_ACC=CAM_ASM_000384 /TAXON_ID=2969 /ORGANISM="Oxyrrhis marina" /LENGTH=55 /DNA_ID=CAMNT_0051348293 /DNA_START=320 /DNA_END=487 /DNA_ORIENTATION=-